MDYASWDLWPSAGARDARLGCLTSPALAPGPVCKEFPMSLSPRPRAAALALALAATFTSVAFAPVAVSAAPKATVDIPYEEFTLPNGLRVVVHTDRKAPIVAVNLWYHVGSKDEPAGRTGFAHLFEHLMFNGSENAPGEFFTPFKQIGVTSQNGTANS